MLTRSVTISQRRHIDGLDALLAHDGFGRRARGVEQASHGRTAVRQWFN